MFGYRGFPGVPLAVQESAGLGVAPHDSLTSSGDVFGVPHSDGWLEPVGVEDSDVLPLHLKHSEPLLASLNLPSNQLITPQIKVLLGKVQKSSMVNEHPSSVAQFKNENYLPFGNQKQGNGDTSAQADVHPQQDSKQKKGKQSIPHVLERIAAPWISPETAQITNSNVKLHNEILEFCWFIEPKEEERLRQKGALEE